MKNVVNLLRNNIKDTQVPFLGSQIPVDPDTKRSLGSRIRMDLSPYCEDGSMIPVDLSAICEGRIYDPNGSGIQILGIRSRDPRTCLTTSIFFSTGVGCTYRKVGKQNYVNRTVPIKISHTMSNCFLCKERMISIS